MWGETFDGAELERLVTFARREGIALHLDGARIFLQAAYSGRSVADLVRPFDTVYVSLYKYFNAPSGAILAGPRAQLDDLYHERRMFGAGLPAAWRSPRWRPTTSRGSWTASPPPSGCRDVHRETDSGRAVRGRACAGGYEPLLAPCLHAGSCTLSEASRRAGRPGGDPAWRRALLVGVNETWNRRSASELGALHRPRLMVDRAVASSWCKVRPWLDHAVRVWR